MKSKRGFTLIELLVVISIIGLLSSIVLASLRSARDKAISAAIMADLHSIQNQAAIYYDTNNKYATNVPSPISEPCDLMNGDVPSSVFGSDANSVYGMSQTLQLRNPAFLVECGLTSSDYFIAFNLKVTGDPYWCVDSRGQAKQVAYATMINAINTGSAICP